MVRECKKYGSKRNKDLTSQIDSTITGYPNEEEKGFGRYRHWCHCSGNSLMRSSGERCTPTADLATQGQWGGNQWLGQGEPPGKAREGKNWNRTKGPFSCVTFGKNETKIGLNHGKIQLNADKTEKAELVNCTFASTFSKSELSSNLKKRTNILKKEVKSTNPGWLKKD